MISGYPLSTIHYPLSRSLVKTSRNTCKKALNLVSPLSTTSWNFWGPGFWIPTKGTLSHPKVDWPCQDFTQGSTIKQPSVYPDVFLWTIIFLYSHHCYLYLFFVFYNIYAIIDAKMCLGTTKHLDRHPWRVCFEHSYTKYAKLRIELIYY